MSVDTASAPTATSTIVAELREAILSGAISAGESLRAQALAARYGYSRTPIREALVMLESEGLVRIAPRRGAIVMTFSAEGLRDLYSVRARLEAYAAELAARRVSPQGLARMKEICTLAAATGIDEPNAMDDHMNWNDEFHSIVIREAGSERTAAALRNLGPIPKPLRVQFYENAEQRDHSLYAHLEIYRAIAAASPERSGAMMCAHLLNARDFMAEIAMSVEAG